MLHGMRTVAIGSAVALALCGGGTLAGAGVATAQTGHHHHGPGGPAGWPGHGTAVFVSASVQPTSGSAHQHATGHASRNHSYSSGCAHATYSTISGAVAAAASGDTVVVCPGTYVDNVLVPASKALDLQGVGDPVVAPPISDEAPGIEVESSGSQVSGFVVRGAYGEGILVGFPPGPSGGAVSHVTVSDNVVTGNDQGSSGGSALVANTDTTYPECAETPTGLSTFAPGDCGEGIHLLSVTDSSVTGNISIGNSGGILLTDENGATTGNTIARNIVSDNVWDCGITVAGHGTAGVSGNFIRNNVVTGNGTKGQGAGVLLATAVPGESVADNTVTGNYLAGNGLAGVTLHAHTSGENLSGNVIEDNTIGLNNLDGDMDFYPMTDTATTGVFVGTDSSLTITIDHNRIIGDTDGVFLGAQTPSGGPAPTITTNPDIATGNAFFGVADPVVHAP